jgi:hypothetical protein
VVSDNNSTTSIFLIVVGAQTADDAKFAAGSLTAIELISILGEDDATATDVDNIQFIA